MASNPFIRAISLTGFDQFARRQGLDPSRILRQARVPALLFLSCFADADVFFVLPAFVLTEAGDAFCAAFA